MREAAALGAAQVPTAREALQRANQQLELARQMENLRDRRAGLMHARAQADAEVALALAREAEQRRQTVRAQEEVRSLRGAP
jgi:hypothetical protein